MADAVSFRPVNGHAAGAQRRSKLSWEDVRTIRELHVAGVPLNDIRARFGLTWFGCSKVVRNLSWVDPSYVDPDTLPRTCEYGGCNVTWVGGRRDKRFCCGQHQVMHHSRAKKGYYERERCKSRRCKGPRCRRQFSSPHSRKRFCSKPCMSRWWHRELVRRRRAEDRREWSARRLDSTPGVWQLHEVIGSERFEPYRVLESELLADVLGDLTEQDVDGLRDDELAALRAELEAAGFRPMVVAA